MLLAGLGMICAVICGGICGCGFGGLGIDGDGKVSGGNWLTAAWMGV